MTAAKGMTWKTPWSRRHGGLVGQPPVNMWFLDLEGGVGGHWSYSAPALSPTFADGPVPFWFGAVVYGAADGTVLNFSAGTTGVNGVAMSALNLTDADGQETQDMSVRVATADGATEVVSGSAILLFDYQTVTVFLCRVTLVAGNVNCDLFVDNVLVTSFSGGAYVVPNTKLTFFGLMPSINGIVGGSGALTDAQVAQWFASVRDAADIQPIAGMTSDLWSASSVEPLAPAVLPNLSTGQALNKTFTGVTTQPATNTLQPVSFNY